MFVEVCITMKVALHAIRVLAASIVLAKYMLLTYILEPFGHMKAYIQFIAIIFLPCGECMFEGICTNEI